MKHAVEIYTDGACRGNPGPGGWGALLRYGDVDKQLYGGEHLTTNNRMELTAAIEALKYFLQIFAEQTYHKNKRQLQRYTSPNLKYVLLFYFLFALLQ